MHRVVFSVPGRSIMAVFKDWQALVPTAWPGVGCASNTRQLRSPEGRFSPTKTLSARLASRATRSGLYRDRISAAS